MGVDQNHVQLADDDGIAKEVVPAKPIEGSQWVVSATPGMVNGCAAGDRIDVQPDGTFVVIERGGNIAVHIYSREPLVEADLLRLRDRFGSLNGAILEWPPARKFAVATVPSTAGFEPIEAIMSDFVAGHSDVEWYFGNVYDERNEPLGWW